LFIKGPLDWPWIRAAMNLRGSAIHVGLLIHFLAGLRCSRTVRVRLSLLPIGRGSADRGLRALERANLISVKRTKGRWPRVTIVECHMQGDR